MTDLEDLDPEIASMLRREGGRVSVPPEAAARVADRVARSIGAMGPGGDGGGGAGGGAGAGAMTIGKLLPFLITFAVGAAAGGAVVASTKSPPIAPLPPVQAVPVSTAIVPLPSATASEAMPSMSVEALPSARTTVAVAPSTTAPVRTTIALGDDSLVAERRILDNARTALGRGDNAAAMASLDEHRKSHPSGRLAEEREALHVRTLADGGRSEEARGAAARFRARWPNSVLWPAVEAAISPR